VPGRAGPVLGQSYHAHQSAQLAKAEGCPSFRAATTQGMGGKWGQTVGVHPKSETEIMVTVLDQENTCHEGTRISQSTERS
jgi:hypothetical protein